MKEQTSCGTSTELITVVVRYPFSSDDEKLQLSITSLVYRNGTAAVHPVNQQTLDHFLKQAHIYGATVFPTTPTAGCYAINGEYLTHAGEWPVSEIYFDGQLIYRIS